MKRKSQKGEQLDKRRKVTGNEFFFHRFSVGLYNVMAVLRDVDSVLSLGLSSNLGYLVASAALEPRSTRRSVARIASSGRLTFG